MRRHIALAILALLATAAVGRPQPQPVPTILDTAIGGDIDQAFGLMYALTSSDIDLRGISTVGDQADERAWIVCRMLTQSESAKRPVIAGAEPQPKVGIDWQIQYRRHPAPIYNRTQKPEKTTAVEWLAKFLANEPVQTTILATGPLTNVARLLKEHPDAARKIERIVCVGSPKNFGADVAAARAVLESKIPVTFVSPELAASAKLEKKQRDELFGLHVPLSFQVQNLYELWDQETPGLAAAIAAADVPLSSSPKTLNTHVVIDDAGNLQETEAGKPNARLITKADLPVLGARLIQSVKVRGKIALPAEPRNLSKLIDRGPFPAKVHVAEDFDTDIEKRWWMSGKAETKDIPPGGVRCLRGVLTQDFDDRQGDMRTSYRAVVFNPVPGPPMGKNTRLAFRYKLLGTDHLRVQLYSLTNGYHRYLSVKGLPENEWQSGAVDMTQMRRPDGSGGPLGEERIDDIQFYVDPRANVLIDDVVLYDAAAPDEKRPFPKRILYTAWFDTGKHGKEWLGDFEIVNHETPRMGKAAKSVAKDGGGSWIRLDLKGERRLGEVVEVGFKHHVAGTDRLMVELRNRKSGKTWTAELTGLPRDRWAQATARFEVGPGEAFADEVRILAITGATVTVDDVLVYVP